MALNSSNRCSTCDGIVRNIDGKRLTIQALTERHNETCPGLRRGTPNRKATSNE